MEVPFKGRKPTAFSNRRYHIHLPDLALKVIATSPIATIGKVSQQERSAGLAQGEGSHRMLGLRPVRVASNSQFRYRVRLMYRDLQRGIEVYCL